jgi:hypothetical protein
MRAGSAPTGSFARVPSAKGNSGCFGLAALPVEVVPEAAVHARGVQALAAEGAGAVGVGERRDHEVALLDVDTSEPVPSTTPMNSCPVRAGPLSGVIGP